MADAKAKKPFHEVVAENLIEQLKQGTAPWQKPWNPGEPGSIFPMNPTTGNRYKGINAIHLMAQGREDNRWMTYKQANAEGAQVRKGEKGTLVQYWKFTEEQAKRDEEGRIVLDENKKPVKEIIQLERPKVFNAVVFNAEQIDGLPEQVRKEKSWDGIARAEDILKASGADIKHDQSDRAFYRTTTDSIHLPQKEAFPTADNYYATALHELGHWTGHSSRLDRDLAHPFGSEGYAKEELRAEIASMILGDELGIGHDPGQHAAYVKSWIKALQDDPLEIFRAAADAEKIQKFVMSLEQQQINQQETSAVQTPEQTQKAQLHDSLMSELQAENDTAALAVIQNLANTAEKAGYKISLSWVPDEHFPDAESIKVNYETAEGTNLPVHTLIVGDGKALTHIGDDRVPGTLFTNDEAWQRDALKAAFASLENNHTLAAKTLKDEIEEISNDPRDLPEGTKFPRNWIPNASFLASKNENTASQPLPLTPQQSNSSRQKEEERRIKAEKFILSNLDNKLIHVIPSMNRSQLTLASDVLNDALSATPKDDFWKRNEEFLAAFRQDWKDSQKHLRTAALEIDTALSAYPSKQYAVIEGSQNDNIVLETNSALKAMEALKHNPERYIRDTGDFNNARVNLNDIENSFHNTLKTEQDAVSNGLIAPDQEIRVIPAGEALEWFHDRVESLMESTQTPQELHAAMEALGPEPGKNEAIFLSDQGQRVMPEGSLSVAQENTFIKVPYKERNEAKSLGAKWDRNEQSWYVPAGEFLDKFTKWNRDNTATTGAAVSSFPKEEGHNTTQERQVLAVPYKDRNEAKAAGAKWDKEKKTWYADAGADMNKLAKWKPENVMVQQTPALSLEEEVGEALKSIGCILDADTDKDLKHPIIDGQTHRITVEGDRRGEKSGFYRIYNDGHPAGFMQNNRTQEELRWKSKGYVQTDEEKALLRAQAAQKQEAKAAQQQNAHEASSKRVEKQLKQLNEPAQPTAYLKKKGLQVHKGVFTDKAGKKTFIPAYDTDGKQWTMQYINEDGSKRFAKNARKEGCFHVVGGLDALKDAPVLIVAEGYATAGSITEATKNPTVAAFDSGNLAPVAKALKEKYPDKPIIIAGDDDIGQVCKMKVKGRENINVGREKALEVAKAVGGVAVFPTFAKGEVPTKEELSLIKPNAYKAHQSALRKLEDHASGEKPLSESEIKVLEAARLSEKQLEILNRAERHTDFNDLAVNSSFGREGVAMQMKAVIAAQMEKQQLREQKQVEKLVQVKEKKRTVRHGM